jgi:hypothetical protein
VRWPPPPPKAEPEAPKSKLVPEDARGGASPRTNGVSVTDSPRPASDAAGGSTSSPRGDRNGNAVDNGREKNKSKLPPPPPPGPPPPRGRPEVVLPRPGMPPPRGPPPFGYVAHHSARYRCVDPSSFATQSLALQAFGVLEVGWQPRQRNKQTTTNNKHQYKRVAICPQRSLLCWCVTC